MMMFTHCLPCKMETFLNRNFTFDEELEKKLSTLSVEEVNSAMKKHISLDKISMFKGGDFANKIKKP